MQHKTIALWLAGILAVLIVACAGAWSLTVATAYAYADEAAKVEATQPAAKTTAADTAGDAAKTQPADEAPGVYQLPLRAKASRAADPAVITPATFTISGKKFLSGRPLEAGEFTFHMAKLGAYTVPLGSKLPSQLRSDTLSSAEKFDLVAYGGLHYLNSSVQPLPDPATVTNAADGTVAFAPITINASMLGEKATQRTTGVIFAYTFAEEPPRNADGTLAPGVTKDSLGRYCYQGVTYDDTLKRAYLYAYQDYDADKNPIVKIIALGDATFDAAPVRDQAGLGVGFRNTYNGAIADDYDGTVYLEGRPIAAGEFNFDVHEVTEDGALTDSETVACESGEGGSEGAEVPVLNGQQLNHAGRYYFAVSQTAAGESAPANVELDKTAYVVTVDVEADAQDKLSADVTAVRKMAEGTDTWVDVGIDEGASTTPLVWENKLLAEEPAAPDDAATPDEPTTPDTPTAPDVSTTPDDSTTPDEPASPGATDTPGTGATAPEGGEADEGAAGASSGSTVGSATAPGNGDVAGGTTGADADNAAADTDKKPAADVGDGESSGKGSPVEAARPENSEAAGNASGNATADSEGDSAGKGAPASEKTEVTKAESSQDDGNPLTIFLAQTDDSLAWTMPVLVALILGSVGALTVAYRRRKQ